MPIIKNMVQIKKMHTAAVEHSTLVIDMTLKSSYKLIFLLTGHYLLNFNNLNFINIFPPTHQMDSVCKPS